MRCLGPWMNHLPHVWWSNFRFMFLNEVWWESLAWWSGIFYSCLVFFIIVFIHCLYYSSHMVSLWNSIFILSTKYYNFPYTYSLPFLIRNLVLYMFWKPSPCLSIIRAVKRYNNSMMACRTRFSCKKCVRSISVSAGNTCIRLWFLVSISYELLLYWVLEIDIK